MSSWGPGPARRVAWVDADPRIQVNKVAHARVHNLLDCRATLAMTRGMCLGRNNKGEIIIPQ